MTSSVQERLKLKRITLDTWSTKEKLSLASSVLRSGDQNWSCVSRNIRPFAEPNRPPDWFSQKNCAQQYASLLENVETPKRKKRTAGSGERSEVETPGESIVRKLTAERIEELTRSMIEVQTDYLKLKNEINAIISGEADDMLPQMLREMEEEKKQKEKDKEAHIKWLSEREERKLELERAWKPGMHLTTIRRGSSMSEPSSEADSPLSEPLNVDVPEEVTLNKTTPTSPLLTSLLKSPSTAAQSSSILHSAITSPHRGSSPTIASLLSSSPGLPTGLAMPPSNVSPNLKNLVTNAIAGSFGEDSKTVPQSPSQGAPTLSMLLELPPSMPGKPLPVLQPQPVAPPPYTEHLGPPPPYSQATEYLQKQRAEHERALAQAQAQLQTPPSQSRIQQQQQKEEARTGTSPVAETTPVAVSSQPLQQRRASLKGRRLDMSGETEVEESKVLTSQVVEQVKQKELKRPMHNTSDHDYVESPIKEKSPRKVVTDVFEFDEGKEGVDKLELTLKDSKMSYLKGNSQRLGLKKEGETSPLKNPEAKSYLRESQPLHEPRIVVTGENDEDIPLKDLAKRESTEGEPDSEQVAVTRRDLRKSLSPVAEGRRSARNSSEGEKKEVEVETFTTTRSQSIDETCKPGNEDVEAVVDVPEIKEEDTSTVESETPKEPEVQEEQSEEEKVEELEDSESAKEEDTLSVMADTMKSEKTGELSTTEDEKSNDAVPKSYTRRRATTSSLCESVPNSPQTEEEKEHKSWKRSIMRHYSVLAGHRFASIFLKGITEDQAPGYASLIHRPMDLSTIKRNIEMGMVRTTAEFQRDVMLMFLNAIMYNKTNDHVYNMAKDMQADFVEHFNMLRQAETGSAPARRETRTQQSSAEGKTRGSEKQKPGRASKTAKPSPSPLVDKQKKATDTTPTPNMKRKRLTMSEGAKKRLKVDDSV